MHPANSPSACSRRGERGFEGEEMKVIDQLIQYFVNNGQLTDADCERLRVNGFEVPKFILLECDGSTAKLKLTKPSTFRIGETLDFDAPSVYRPGTKCNEIGTIDSIDASGVASLTLCPF